MIHELVCELKGGKNKKWGEFLPANGLSEGARSLVTESGSPSETGYFQPLFSDATICNFAEGSDRRCRRGTNE
jgi:hypothetical protein